MTIDWNGDASLLDAGFRFPVHGTLESCIRIWRTVAKPAQDAASLWPAAPVCVKPDSDALYSFHGEALQDLSAVMENRSPQDKTGMDQEKTFISVPGRPW